MTDGEPLGVHQRASAKLVEVEVGGAELQQAGAGLLFARVEILLDEAVSLERLQQAMDGSRGELEPLGSSLTPKRRAPLASALRMRAARSIDWIPPRFLRFPLVFGVGESKWSLQGGAHWSAASEWRTGDGVPSPGATARGVVDSRQKRR